MNKEVEEFQYILEVAKFCHNINKAYCESLGDTSQLSWDKAPSWQKESAINGVKYHLDNKDSKPSDSHENWMKEKVQNGWVYGEKKDLAKKTHPCIVPYEQLPQEQKAKDYIFLAIVREFDRVFNEMESID